MVTPIEQQRQVLCKALVRNGVRTVRDGADHSSKANRCIVGTGECVGYYTTLMDYDEMSDTFRIGWSQRIPANQVDEVALFDAILKIIKTIPLYATAS